MLQKEMQKQKENSIEKHKMINTQYFQNEFKIKHKQIKKQSISSNNSTVEFDENTI